MSQPTPFFRQGKEHWEVMFSNIAQLVASQRQAQEPSPWLSLPLPRSLPHSTQQQDNKELPGGTLLSYD